MLGLKKIASSCKKLEPLSSLFCTNFYYSSFNSYTKSKTKASCDRYRKESALEEGEDHLDWWRPRRPQFPKLWRLVRKYMCVPATSTPAVRVFGWMNFLLNKRRLSLSGERVSMHLFLRDNIEL